MKIRIPKKIYKGVLRVLPFLLIAALVFSVVFSPRAGEQAKAEKTVVRVWNVDTFEGGKGSRTAFLKRACTIAERGGSAYYLVSSYTAEGAREAISKGIKPDVLSFGIGLSEFLEVSLPLPYEFAGGSIDGSCFAIPWCRGEYYLFSLIDDFEEAGEVIISEGGENFAALAALQAGIEGETMESLSAYVAFLNGKCRYLVGTQRDACRLNARGVNYYSKTLPLYCDLYQYYSVLSREKEAECIALLEALLSEEVQGMLGDIGMLRTSGDPAERTLSVFSARSALGEIRELLGQKTDAKNISKFLKNV